jgi:nicotinic acid phosphoribosyltransferase
MSCHDGGALLTGFYQLTMLQAYFDQGMADTAVFASSSSYASGQPTAIS